MQRATDFVLFQAQLDASAAATLRALPSLLPLLSLATSKESSPLAGNSAALRPATLYRAAFSREINTAYVYLQLNEQTQVSSEELARWRTWFARAVPLAQNVRASRLECVFDKAGHSHAAATPFHYVVEMDPDAGWMPEIARWYDTEHMPGLAAVPGCARAMRMLNHDHCPLSLACYDLERTETLGSPPWLAVRNTAWSDITRPHFTNTKRTMFEMVA